MPVYRVEGGTLCPQQSIP